MLLCESEKKERKQREDTQRLKLPNRISAGTALGQIVRKRM